MTHVYIIPAHLRCQFCGSYPHDIGCPQWLRMPHAQRLMEEQLMRTTEASSRPRENGPNAPVKTVQLWRVLDDTDTIQPGDCYCSSFPGGMYRCPPDLIGKKLADYSMVHLRPAGTRQETET